jgi:hypothetical protein
MLARRFTIVCLILTIFGIELAGLVAETSHPAQAWENGAAARCVLLQGARCAPVRN